jgi:hypothetical protein
MGRPKADRRQTRVQVFLDEDELATLEKIARMLGGSLSAAARLAISYGAPIARENLEGGRKAA